MEHYALVLCHCVTSNSGAGESTSVGVPSRPGAYEDPQVATTKSDRPNCHQRLVGMYLPFFSAARSDPSESV